MTFRIQRIPGTDTIGLLIMATALKLNPQAWGILAWLRLIRLPTVFTAIANVLCGFVITHADAEFVEVLMDPSLLLLILASAGLYLSGMVLNDVFDADLDSRERPERPIPSGAISRKAATILGVLLMTIGVMAAAGVRWQQSGSFNSLWIAAFLVVAVLAYNALLKATLFSPFGMALCRFLNIMLGASAVGTWAQVWSGPQVYVATGLALYIVGVTLFSRNEAVRSSTPGLYFALLLVCMGVAFYGWVVLGNGDSASSRFSAVLALALVATNLTVRGVSVAGNPQPMLVQKTVGLMLLSIIFLDTATILGLTGNARLATLCLMLVIPATLLKRLIPLS